MEIKFKSTTIIKFIHQIVGNMIEIQVVEKWSFTKDNMWEKIHTTTNLSILSTYGTILEATPVQLIFERDMLHDVKHVTDWEIITLHKQNIIESYTARENKKYIHNCYMIGD